MIYTVDSAIQLLNNRGRTKIAAGRLVGNQRYKGRQFRLALSSYNKSYIMGHSIKALGYIPLISRVFGLYCKLRTEFFSIDLWPKREARIRNLQYGPKKRG